MTSPTHFIWALHLGFSADELMQDFQVGDTVLSTNAEDGAETVHVTFLQLLDIPLVQSPGLRFLEEVRDSHSSVDYQLCGHVDVRLIEHSSMQLPQYLAGLADFFAKVSSLEIMMFPKYLKLFSFVSWVSSAFIHVGLMFCMDW